MRQPLPALAMSAGQREVLESLARSQSGAHREVVRAKALLMAGTPGSDPSDPTAQRSDRVAGLFASATQRSVGNRVRRRGGSNSRDNWD